MKKMFSNEFIQDLIRTANIKEIMEPEVGKIIKESNDEYSTYHKNKHGSDSKKSLKINTQKGVYYCFNCGEGGTAINWLMNNRNMSFVEAIKYLAHRTGMTLPNIDPKEQEKFEKQMQERNLIEHIYNLTAKFYNEQMEGKHYKLLKKKYGIKKKTIDDLMIGFAPIDGADLKVYLIENTKYKFSKLKKTGLFVNGYDFFQGRIIFPYWKNGKVAFFIGRKTEDTPDKNWERGKYKKILTNKDKYPYISEVVENKYFYGEDTVRGSDNLIITEGITDSIMAHQAGFSCISPVTVQFRKKDYPKLLRLAKKVNKVYIANDNEDNQAGKKGAQETANFLFERGINVKIINLPKPEGIKKVDLAEYLRDNTSDDFKELMKKAKNPLEMSIEKVNQASEFEKHNFAEELYPMFYSLEPMRKESYINKLYEAFGGRGSIRKEILREKINNVIDEKHNEKNTFEKNETKNEVNKKGPVSSIFEDDKGYYYPKETKEGKTIKNHISNFKLDIDKILFHPKEGEVLSGEIVYYNDDKTDFSFSSEAFVSNINFKKKIPSKAVWLGGNTDLQKLKINVHSKKPSIIDGVLIAGRHDTKIVMPNLTIGKKGPIDNPQIALIDLYKSNFLSKLPNDWPDQKDYQKAVDAIYEHLPYINKPSIAGAVIAWNFALPWCELIRTKIGWGGFPHLIIFGEAGSGKTQTGKLIWRLNGISQDQEPFSLPGTRFTRINNYSLTNLVPILLDEYRPGAWDDFKSRAIHEELRNIYNRNAVERGRADLTTKIYSYSTPIILCGEDRPRDTTGLEERMIVLNPTKNIIDGVNQEYKKSCKNEFLELQKAPLESFGLYYWKWALNQNDWEEKLEYNKEKVIELKESKDLKMSERIINNLSILRFGWNMYKTFGSDINLIGKLSTNINIDEVLQAAYYEVMPEGKHLNEFDELLNFIAIMVNNSEVHYRVHYTIKKDNILILRIRDIIPKARKYAYQTKKNRELLGVDAYYSIIKRLVKDDSYVISSSQKGTFRKSSELRGVAINIDKLEDQLGIEKEIWIN